MSTLQIRLLGNLQLLFDGDPLPCLPTERSRALFTFLILHPGRRLPREALVRILWGNHPRASGRAHLQTEVLRICSVLQTLPDPVGACLHVSAEQIGFGSPGERFCTDVAEFERCVHAADLRAGAELPMEQVQLLHRAVHLYRGDLVPELEDEWCALERQRLRRMYAAALEALIVFHRSREQWDAAKALQRRLLDAGAAQQPAHRGPSRGPTPSRQPADAEDRTGTYAAGARPEAGRPSLVPRASPKPPLYEQVESVLAGLRAARQPESVHPAPAADTGGGEAVPRPPSVER